MDGGGGWRREVDQDVIPAREEVVMQVKENVECLMNKTAGGKAENRILGAIGDKQRFLHGFLEEEETSLEYLDVKRSKLHAELEIMEKVLKKIADEEQRQMDRLRSEKGGQSGNCHSSGDVKRRRRPNPKYFSRVVLTDVTQAPTLHTSAHMSDSTIAGSSHAEKQQPQTTEADEVSEYIHNDSTELGEFPGTLSDGNGHVTETSMPFKSARVKNSHTLIPQISCSLIQYDKITDCSPKLPAIMKDSSLEEKSNDDCLTEHTVTPYGDILIRGSRIHTNELFEAASGAKLLSGGILNGHQSHKNGISMMEMPTTFTMGRSFINGYITEHNENVVPVHTSTDMHTCKKQKRKRNHKYSENEGNIDSGRVIARAITITSNAINGDVF